jgi:hypothetical protein
MSHFTKSISQGFLLIRVTCKETREASSAALPQMLVQAEVDTRGEADDLCNHGLRF